MTLLDPDDFQNSLKKYLEEFQKAQAKAMKELTKSPSFTIDFIREFQKAQAKAIQQWGKKMSLTQEPIPAKLITPLLDLNRLTITSPLKTQLDKTISFYSERDLESLRSPKKIETTKPRSLLSKLKNCSSGQNSWLLYQNICGEILSYCLVPPLSEMVEQSKTKDNVHVRDIVFNIPHDLGGFWTSFMYRFGWALIFECKNYGSYLKQNQLIISSKYLGAEKMSTLGIIITRKGLSKNAQKVQDNLWRIHKTMLLCFNDSDMENLLKLKENDDEPWKVIDNSIRKFLSSIS